MYPDETTLDLDEALETTVWDRTDSLTSEDDVAAALNVALSEGDETDFLLAVGDIARAYSMGKIAQETGLSRESLYRALSAEGNPRFTTVLSVLDSLGYQFEINPKPRRRPVEEERVANHRTSRGKQA